MTPVLRLYNSLTKQKEIFEPVDPPRDRLAREARRVGLYTCGITVYDYAHIGHGRKYVNDDILRRTLAYLGYKVKHVQNVTDVGHLVSDADEGEDKLEKGAKKSGKTVWEVARFFTDEFYASMDKLNILRPHVIAKATDHIPQQIALIRQLIEKDYAYDTPEAVYFDVTRFTDYGQLFGQDLGEKRVAVRDEVETGTHKKHPADFALWFKHVGRFADHVMHWSSPWGEGFPGWHIECSAISLYHLTNLFADPSHLRSDLVHTEQSRNVYPEPRSGEVDIHTGGIDHLSLHHPNEIAQSEAATSHPFVRYWIHHNFLTVDGQKMSKSLGNFYRVDDVIEHGFDPLALRYLYLTAHYRKQLNFTWEALESAQNALSKLKDQSAKTKAEPSKDQKINVSNNQESKNPTSHFPLLKTRFLSAISDDLNLPRALATTWDVIKSDLTDNDKFGLLKDFDQVLGLNLTDWDTPNDKKPPTKVTQLANERQKYRRGENFAKADELREQIRQLGYQIEDLENNTHHITKM